MSSFLEGLLRGLDPATVTSFIIFIMFVLFMLFIKNKEPFINGNDAITSMKIVDAIYESSKSSSTIDINY